MPNLAMKHHAEVDCVGHRRTLPAFRTLLAGSFTSPDGPHRLLLEGMLEGSTGNRAHHVLTGRQGRCLNEQAETYLARNAVDIVVLDLDGPIEAMLALVQRLRAAANQGVIFVGILGRQATDASRLYLSAVVDEVVDGPLRAGSLHRAIADALQHASEFQGGFGGAMFAASETRH